MIGINDKYVICGVESMSLQLDCGPTPDFMPPLMLEASPENMIVSGGTTG